MAWEKQLRAALNEASKAETLQQIAARADINSPSLYRFRAGSGLSLALAEKLAKTLGVKLQ